MRHFFDHLEKFPDVWSQLAEDLWLFRGKVYKIMIVGMQNFTKLWLLGCKFTLEKLDLGVTVSIRLHSGIFLPTQTSFLISPTRKFSACQTHDNFPFSTIFFLSFFSNTWLQSLKDRVRTSVGLVYMHVPGINTNSKDHTSLVGVPALYQPGKDLRYCQPCTSFTLISKLNPKPMLLCYIRVYMNQGMHPRI
jgi:hypothetical protein